MSDERLTKKVFNWDYEIGSNWLQDIKDILYEINMQEDFVMKWVSYLNNVESKCIELDKSEMLSSIPLKPKLRTYQNYKMEMKTEDYVKYCLNRKRCSIISQFRIGILPLHIETGRFRNVKEDERKCHVCNNEDIENEFHFLCL